MSYSAVIIGAGNIAAGFDSPGDEKVLTHVHALQQHKRINSINIFDCEWSVAQSAAAKWNITPLRNFSQIVECKPDLIIVAVPDAYHEYYLDSICMHPPKLVLSEKPLTMSYAASARIVNMYQQHKIALAVNYQRRFDSAVNDLKKRIESGEIGSPLGGVVWYSKGILHNGSHAIDLLRYLFGEIETIYIRNKIYDYNSIDPTVTGSLQFGNVTIELVGGDESKFSLFEVDLLFEKARYRFIQSGMFHERYSVQPDPVFPGYFELMVEHAGKTGLSTAMANMANSLVDYLDGAHPLHCPASDTLRTQFICELLANAENNYRMPVTFTKV